MTLSIGYYAGRRRQQVAFIASLGLTNARFNVAFSIFYIILGCFLDGISMVVMTMGVILPGQRKL